MNPEPCEHCGRRTAYYWTPDLLHVCGICLYDLEEEDIANTLVEEQL